jgi:peptidoglycan/xylan/chitin deacetylase (PgdA/CDA1 family)
MGVFSAGFVESIAEDVVKMKRLMCLLLCAVLLPLPVRGAPAEKLVALTFDDGPSGRFTRRLLDGLEETDTRATFLLCGYRMEDYPELVERILKEGHEIGLHGYSHEPMEKMTPEEIGEELRRTWALIPEGTPVRFLRPPGGALTDGIRETAKELDLAVLLWSVDPRDWATEDSRAIETAVLDSVRDGDVILLHDMSDSSVDAALSLVKKLRGQGFRFVTVSELARSRGGKMDPGTVWFRFEG